MEISNIKILDNISPQCLMTLKDRQQFVCIKDYGDSNIKGIISGIARVYHDCIYSAAYNECTPSSVEDKISIDNIYFDNEKLEDQFIVLDKKMKVTAPVYDYDLYDTNNKTVYQYMPELIEMRILYESNRYVSSKILDKTDALSSIMHTVMIPLEHDNYLFIQSINEISTKNYYWNCSYKYYVFNFKRNQCISLESESLIKLLPFISILQTIPELKQFIENDYIGLTYDIPQYLEDLKSNRNELDKVIRTFKNAVPKEVIEFYFKPVYTNDQFDFKAYASSIHNTYMQNLTILYDTKNILNNLQDIKNCRRKAKNRLEYLQGNSPIDIYSGEIIADDVFKIYSDTMGIIIRRGGLFNVNINSYYVLLDEVFVEANSEEKSDLEARRDIYKKLQ